jgi:transcriptional regulator
VYTPAQFSEPDLATLHAFIEANSFAVLFSWGGEPFASHLPLLLERTPAPRGRLLGHVARANPQWRTADGQRVLAVFSGPHAYVSPSWYEEPDVVPTWNYVAVHATGVFRAVDEPGAARALVGRMVDFYERGRERPWEFRGSPGYLERMLRGIVAFEIDVERIEGKWKLSQNHPPARRARVIRGLRGQDDPDARAVADLMEQRDGVSGRPGEESLT